VTQLKNASLYDKLGFHFLDWRGDFKRNTLKAKYLPPKNTLSSNSRFCCQY